MADDDKSQTKDLTTLAEYSKKLHDAGEEPPAVEGSISVEPKIETIASFESLEDFSKSNPVVAAPNFEPNLNSPDLSGAVTGVGGDNQNVSDGLETAAAIQQAIPPEELAGLEESQISVPTFNVESTEEVPAANTSVLDKIKSYTQKLTAGKPPVQAAYPFSILIVGRLSNSDKEKLVDLIDRNQMGISALDLEPQFAAGKVLIPRISEYAGVLIVQAFRSAAVRVFLGPSDSIFSTVDTHVSETDPYIEPRADSFSVSSTDDGLHPAESIPVTPLASLPGGDEYRLLDAITASASLKTSVVEAESSSEYQEVLEGLKREMKYKAYRKGADAVVNFSISLTLLSVPSRYRLTVMGSAVKRV